MHFRPEDFADGTGAADIEKLGTITTDLLATWLARHDLSDTVLRVRPVLDLNADWSVDPHDPPERMREQVMLTHSTCVFPGCRRDSRACDLDHIEAYVPIDDGGPPGQTRPDNLAPLCRRHHRVKTHTAWTYKQIAPGSSPGPAPPATSTTSARRVPSVRDGPFQPSCASRVLINLFTRDAGRAWSTGKCSEPLVCS